jgi:hypothetical protein
MTANDNEFSTGSSVDLEKCVHCFRKVCSDVQMLSRDFCLTWKNKDLFSCDRKQ